MLVLSRKANETVLIEGGIEIKVLAVRGDVVRIGIAAPREVEISRGELSPKQERQDASDS